MNRVAEWRPVTDRWFLHRPEPLLHDRMWGCALPPVEPLPWLPGRFYGGFDEAGRAVAWRNEEVREPLELLQADGNAMVVRTNDTVVRTTFDEHGRPARTDYTGRYTESETYEYDADGKLVVINEADHLWFTLAAYSPRYTSGGRLIVHHDDAGVAAITGARGRVVWERPSLSWSDRLDEWSSTAANAVIAALPEFVTPETELFGLTLMYVEDGGLHLMLWAGLEEHRREWLRSNLSPDELGVRLLSLNEVGCVEVDIDPDESMMRVSSSEQPGDPHRVPLAEVAGRVARADLTGVLTPTDDFVVFIAEHDEGLEPKVASIRESNPPEQVARWEASWPPGAKRDDRGYFAF